MYLHEAEACQEPICLDYYYYYSWFGHVMRMEEYRIPKRFTLWKLKRESSKNMTRGL